MIGWGVGPRLVPDGACLSTFAIGGKERGVETRSLPLEHPLQPLDEPRGLRGPQLPLTVQEKGDRRRADIAHAGQFPLNAVDLSERYFSGWSWRKSGVSWSLFWLNRETKTAIIHA